MPAAQYLPAILVTTALVPMTLYGASGFFLFVGLALFFVWLLFKQVRTRGRKWLAILASLCWFCGGVMLHMFASSARAHLLLPFPVFGQGGGAMLVMGALLSLCLIKDPYLT
jgi:hypothetical protein